MVPMSLLNQLRRELVARLDEAAAAVPARAIAAEPVLPSSWSRSRPNANAR